MPLILLPRKEGKWFQWFSLSSRPDQYTPWVPGKPGLHSKTLKNCDELQQSSQWKFLEQFGAHMQSEIWTQPHKELKIGHRHIWWEGRRDAKGEHRMASTSSSGTGKLLYRAGLLRMASSPGPWEFTSKPSEMTGAFIFIWGYGYSGLCIGQCFA